MGPGRFWRKLPRSAWSQPFLSSDQHKPRLRPLEEPGLTLSDSRAPGLPHGQCCGVGSAPEPGFQIHVKDSKYHSSLLLFFPFDTGFLYRCV